MKRTLALLIVFLSLVAASLPAVARASSVLPGIMNGTAYAGYLITPLGSDVASIGPLFQVSGGTSSASSMSLGSFASTGTLIDQVTSSRTATSASVQASSAIQHINVLNGLITADTVNAVASSAATATNASSTNSSTFVNLVVANQTISSSPKPNTTIPLNGLGYVVLNEQSGPVSSATSTSISVTAIDVHVTLSNELGLPVGARLIIGHAVTSFVRTSLPLIVGAQAYGLYITGLAGPGSTSSGPWAMAGIGGAGGSDTATLASVTVAGVGSTGLMTDSASGQIASGADATAKANVQSVYLLGGLISIGAVTTMAHVAWNNGKGSVSGTTQLSKATIAGVPVSANPGPNTKIPLPSLGYVVLNEQTSSSSASVVSEQVIGLDIHITANKLLGLPVGARIIVGNAKAVIINYG
jgi:hypothetical protein